MRVLKFGGSSLENTKKVQNVADFIQNELKKQGEKLVVVVSAMGKTTSKLVDFCQNLSHGSRHTLSSIITQGENLSAAILCYELEGRKIKASWLSSKDAHIYAKGDPLNAIITHIDKTNILKCLRKSDVVIITGFQGVDNKDHVLALGRGGSDTTAVALSIVLDCEVEIYTDVDGFYTLDPNKYEQCKKLETINIYSATEQAHVGAKVLDKRCIELANKYKKQIYVGEPKKGVSVMNFAPLEGYTIDSISCKNEVVIVNNSTNICQFMQNNFLFASFSPNGTMLCKETESEEKLDETTLCDLIIITGSGFTIHNEFINKVFAILRKEGIDYIGLDLHPTLLKLLVPSGKGDKTVSVLSRLITE